ncbi:MAG: Gp49 family protein [Fusobacteriaceae bacterium]
MEAMIPNINGNNVVGNKFVAEQLEKEYRQILRDKREKTLEEKMKKETSILKVSLLHLCNTGAVAKEEFNLFEIENNKIPKELVQSFIIDKEITTERVFGKITTVLKYQLKNGFTGIESTTCVDESNYSEEIGAEILLERLKDKIWFGLGFALGMAQN